MEHLHHCHCKSWAGGKCTCRDVLNDLPIQATLKFYYTAGLLLRKQIKAELLSIAHNLGVSIDIQLNDGWVDSTYYVTIKGDAEKIMGFKSGFE